ncbi:MAG: hypothetical protein HYS26_04245 [Candidatus Kaiserbacteria bacterium]|nr:MAG: hypothetical protein HYS26_04245 [Candidatus Kaiserbacteria bacterium]
MATSVKPPPLMVEKSEATKCAEKLVPVTVHTDPEQYFESLAVDELPDPIEIGSFKNYPDRGPDPKGRR